MMDKKERQKSHVKMDKKDPKKKKIHRVEILTKWLDLLLLISLIFLDK